ncbi:MAG: hypothetical protein NVS4B3_17490 [Gemmatimonadaceae bacterium]
MAGPLAGSSPTDDGVSGETTSLAKSGTVGRNNSPGTAQPPGGNGVFGLTAATGGAGVFGVADVPGGTGVFGANGAPYGTLGRGVQGNGPEAGVGGFSKEGTGVLAQSDSGTGALAESKTGDGVSASTASAERSGVLGRNVSGGWASGTGGNGIFGVTDAYGGAGVFGANNAVSPNPLLGREPGRPANPGAGISGSSQIGDGVIARSVQGNGLSASTDTSNRNGVVGSNTDGTRVPAKSRGGNGVYGVTVSVGGSGVFGANTAPYGNAGRGVQGNGPEAGVGGFSEHGIGVLAQSGGIGLKAQAPIAGHFEGDLQVTGNIQMLGGGDCAEDFDVLNLTTTAPGSVMVLDDGGGVRVCDREYDTRVAGVISGAGTYAPALILDRQAPSANRLPLALLGKVFCKVDASRIPVAIGDLLTTSLTPGHAMKATDPHRAFGAVIGKALQGCVGECGLIPILVALN